MKKLILIFFMAFITFSVMAQNNFKYGIKANGGIAIGTGNEEIDSAEIDTSDDIIYLFHAGDTLYPYVPTNDQIVLSSIAPLLVDTIPLATFGAGAGLIADTALFNNGVLIGSFYNEGSDTLVITQLMGVMKEGTGTETISVQFSWHATFLSGSATSLNAAALAITSLTTGTSDVSFANSKIPPNVFVWGILSGASKDNKPTFLSVTLSGYKIPGY